MILLIVLFLLQSSVCIKTKQRPAYNDMPVSVKRVIGLDTPTGPLCGSFMSELRLPGFPFEFPAIIPGSDKKYLVFPPDTAANYLASARRCVAVGGRLVRLENAVELEILACAIGAPSFVAGWEGRALESCLVLYPGGVLSSKK